MMSPAGGEHAANPIAGLLPFILIIPLFYFLLIRPQKKQQQAVKDMQTSLKKNDHVVTSGGIHGVIANVKDHTVMLKLADNLKIEVNKSSIAHVVTEKNQTLDTSDKIEPTE